jgi:hypothetical protein
MSLQSSHIFLESVTLPDACFPYFEVRNSANNFLPSKRVLFSSFRMEKTKLLVDRTKILNALLITSVN